MDDPVDDPDVTLTLTMADAKPLVGTHGQLLPNQTMVRDLGAPVSTTTEAWLSDGVLETEPFYLTIPMVVFGITYIVNMHVGRIRATLVPGIGLVDGLLGGGFEADALYDVALNADADVPEIFFGVIYEVSDMAPDADGICRQISAALPFTAVPVFLLD